MRPGTLWAKDPWPPHLAEASSTNWLSFLGRYGRGEPDDSPAGCNLAPSPHGLTRVWRIKGTVKFEEVVIPRSNLRLWLVGWREKNSMTTHGCPSKNYGFFFLECQVPRVELITPLVHGLLASWVRVTLLYCSCSHKIYGVFINEVLFDIMVWRCLLLHASVCSYDPPTLLHVYPPYFAYPLLQ